MLSIHGLCERQCLYNSFLRRKSGRSIPKSFMWRSFIASDVLQWSTLASIVIWKVSVLRKNVMVWILQSYWARIHLQTYGKLLSFSEPGDGGVCRCMSSCQAAEKNWEPRQVLCVPTPEASSYCYRLTEDQCAHRELVSLIHSVGRTVTTFFCCVNIDEEGVPSRTGRLLGTDGDDCRLVTNSSCILVADPS